MSETITKTATTEHGEVMYETVVCSSCENEVRKEDAYQFIMGSPSYKRDRSYNSYVKYKFDRGSVSEGWACEFCYGDPIDYPKPATAVPSSVRAIPRFIVRSALMAGYYPKKVVEAEAKNIGMAEMSAEMLGDMVGMGLAITSVAMFILLLALLL